MTETAIFTLHHRTRNVEVNDKAPAGTPGEVDEKAFERMFKAYFKPLHAYAYTILKDEATAEEMVQNVFFNLWDRRERMNIEGSLKAYLYRAVHNESLNFLKHQKVRASYRDHYTRQAVREAESSSGKIGTEELSTHIKKALDELPPQCGAVFRLSRFGGLKYREIAGELGISVKTVENQMGKALRILRTKLAEFLPVWILLFSLYFQKGGLI